jgi:hypothetical protein
MRRVAIFDITVPVKSNLWACNIEVTNTPKSGTGKKSGTGFLTTSTSLPKNTNTLLPKNTNTTRHRTTSKNG